MVVVVVVAIQLVGNQLVESLLVLMVLLLVEIQPASLLPRVFCVLHHAVHHEVHHGVQLVVSLLVEIQQRHHVVLLVHLLVGIRSVSARQHLSFHAILHCYCCCCCSNPLGVQLVDFRLAVIHVGACLPVLLGLRLAKIPMVSLLQSFFCVVHPLVALPLVAIPLVAIPLAEIPLVAIPLVVIPLVAIRLVAIPLVALRLVAVPLVGLPLVVIPLVAVPLVETPQILHVVHQLLLALQSAYAPQLLSYVVQVAPLLVGFQLVGIQYGHPVVHLVHQPVVILLVGMHSLHHELVHPAVPLVEAGVLRTHQRILSSV